MCHVSSEHLVSVWGVSCALREQLAKVEFLHLRDTPTTLVSRAGQKGLTSHLSQPRCEESELCLLLRQRALERKCCVHTSQLARAAARAGRCCPEISPHLSQHRGKWHLETAHCASLTALEPGAAAAPTLLSKQPVWHLLGQTPGLPIGPSGDAG